MRRYSQGGGRERGTGGGEGQEEERYRLYLDRVLVRVSGAVVTQG